MATTLPIDSRTTVPGQPQVSLPERAVAGCPALGLEGDRATYYLVPTSAHVCYVEGEAQRAPTLYQEAFCLSGRHLECPVWQGDERLAAPRRRRIGAPNLLELSLAGRVCAGAAAGVLLLGALGVGLAVRTRGSQSARGPVAAQRPITAAAASVPLSPANPPAVPVLAAPTASAAAPTPAAPALAAQVREIANTITAALAAPPPARLYTVRPGDSLSAVAAQFQITVTTLAQANGLAATARLTVGQQLVIPNGAR